MKILIISILLVGCSAQTVNHRQSISWNAHIKPLFDKHCMNCHGPDGNAFALNTYDQVVQRLPAITSALKSRRMPVWLAESGHQLYQDDPTLTTSQINMVERWQQAGSPRGAEQNTSGDEPGRTLTEFDTQLPILPEGVRYRPNPALQDEYRCFLTMWPGDDAFITGFQLEPGNRKLVHHLVAYRMAPELAQALSEHMRQRKHQQDGYQCFGGSLPDSLSQPSVRQRWEKAFPGVLAHAQIKSRWLFHWAPGMGKTNLPEGLGYPIKKGDAVVFQVHYYRDQKPESFDEGGKLLLDITDHVEKPALVFPITKNRWMKGKENGSSVVPAQGTQTVSAHLSMAKISKMVLAELGMNPGSALEIHGANLHMHAYGASAETWLTEQAKPDVKNTLLHIPQWDLRWQRDYLFQKPIVIPQQQLDRFTQHLRCTFANHGDEPIYGGYGSDDEMCVNMSMYAVVP